MRQHLKEFEDPIMKEVLLEIENMLARGRMDLPLSLCFATLGGYDSLLHQLLRRGLDPNESDSNGRAALHIAASKGNEKCVLLLLENKADPNSRDSEGNVPLWEAILADHEPVIKLLTDNGANISSGDVGRFASVAAEQNKLGLLKNIVRYGGDITCPKSNGSTALHVAVRVGNTEMVKFLLDRGADVDKADDQGRTPRELADQQGHEDIKTLLQSDVPVAYFTSPEEMGPVVMLRMEQLKRKKSLKMMRRFVAREIVSKNARLTNTSSQTIMSDPHNRKQHMEDLQCMKRFIDKEIEFENARLTKTSSQTPPIMSDPHNTDKKIK